MRRIYKKVEVALIFLNEKYFTMYGGSRVVKKGKKYKCETCGLVVVVDKDCGCAECDLICCGVPLKEVK